MVWSPPNLGIGHEGSAAYRRRKASRTIGRDVPTQKPYSPSLNQAISWAQDPLRQQQITRPTASELASLRKMERDYLADAPLY